MKILVDLRALSHFINVYSLDEGAGLRPLDTQRFIGAPLRILCVLRVEPGLLFVFLFLGLSFVVLRSFLIDRGYSLSRQVEASR